MVGKLLQTVSALAMAVAAGYYVPASARPPEVLASPQSGATDAGIKPPAQPVKSVSAVAPIGKPPAQATIGSRSSSTETANRQIVSKKIAIETEAPVADDIADVDVPAEEEIADAYGQIDDGASDTGYSYDDGPVYTGDAASFFDLSRDRGIERADLEAQGGWAAGITPDSSSAVLGVSSVGLTIAANEQAEGNGGSGSSDDNGLDGLGDGDGDSSGSGGGADDGADHDAGGDDGADNDAGDDHGDSGGGDSDGGSGRSGGSDSDGGGSGRSGGGDSDGGGSRPARAAAIATVAAIGWP